MNRDLFDLQDLFETPVRSEAAPLLKGPGLLDSNDSASDKDPSASAGPSGTFITPLMLDKIGAIPATDQPTLKPVTSVLLKHELDAVTVPNEPTESFIQRLFPLQRLPIDVLTVFKFLELTDYARGKWLFAPSLDLAGTTPGQREGELATFIQEITKAAALSSLRKDLPSRHWTSMFCGKAIGSDGENKMNRKPDLLGLKRGVVRNALLTLAGRFGWRLIDLVGEIRNGPSTTWPQIHVELANKAFCMLKHQWNRRFVVMYSMLRYLCKVSVYSRAGVVHCVPFDINQNPLLFLQVIIGLTFGDDEMIGYDPTFKTDSLNKSCSVQAESLYKKCSVQVRDESYRIVGICWRSDVIQGRATQCFLVIKNNAYFVIKDVWICRKRKPTELYLFLRAMANKVRNIPALIDFWNVTIEGELDTCEVGTGKDTLVDRIHRRYVFQDCGVPIWEFKTLRELISAFINYVEAHSDLYFKADIIHRDVSLWNLMLKVNKALKEDSKIRQGLLIDLDYARLRYHLQEKGKDWDVTNKMFLFPEEENSNSYRDFRNKIAKNNAEALRAENLLRSNVSLTGKSTDLSQASEAADKRAGSEDNVADAQTPATLSSEEGSDSDNETTNSISSTETITVIEDRPEEATVKKDDDPFAVIEDEYESEDVELVLEEEEVEETPSEREERRRQRGHRTGTKPFMAAEILMDPKTDHEYRHDLESFLYILMYICIRFSGPNGKLVPGGGKKALPEYMQEWFKSTSLLSLGSAKWGMMTLPSKMFYDQYLSDFQPYFNSLKPCVNKLRKMFASRRDITHENMIKILNETLARLPEDESIDVSTPSAGKKRPRDNIRDPSDFVQTKFTKRPTTVGGDEAYTRRRFLEEDIPGIKDDMGFVGTGNPQAASTSDNDPQAASTSDNGN